MFLCRTAFGLDRFKTEIYDMVTPMEPILKTKLFAPRNVDGVIDRSQLIQKIDSGQTSGALTLVSAPAGSGKTTLVAGLAREKAWLSLDEDDNDPARFWSYVVAAIRCAAQNVDKDIATFFETTNPVVKQFLVGLINELSSCKEKITFVIDDYHVIENTSIHDNLKYFIERLPCSVHMIIITRSDPPISFGRLRAQGKLTEIREADLRFSTGEAGLFFKDVMQITVENTLVEKLTTRTEGWISGLKLAALSMRGSANVNEFVASFTGNNQHVLDYLMEEVFARLNAGDQDFLLRTAFLDRMSGPLCDAVTGRKDGAHVLGRLARANLFIVSLDQERCWYRYHHLFADLLKMRSTVDSKLHARASVWFEAEGFVAEAISHARGSGDLIRCAELIERTALEEIGFGRFATVQRWLEDVPLNVIQGRPLLCVISAWIQVFLGKVEDAIPFMMAASQARDKRVQAHLGLIQAFGSLLQGQLSEAVRLAEGAREQLRGDPAYLSDCAFVIGMASRDQGDLVRALDEARELERLGRESRSVQLVLMGMYDRAVNFHFQCRLTEAAQLCRDAIAYAVTRNAEGYSPTSRIELELASLLRLFGDSESALTHAEAAISKFEDCEVPSDWLNAHIIHGQILLTLGRVDEAFKALSRADEVFVSHDIFPILAAIYRSARSNLLLKMGKVDEANALVGTSDLSPGLLGDINALALGRLKLAINQPEAVLELHKPRVEAARNRKFFLVMMLTQLAVAQEQLGQRKNAFLELDGALEICARAGFRQFFIDEGEAIGSLIEHGLRQRRWSGTIETFAASLVEISDQGLVEPLSGREIEVLHLLAEGNTNKKIAKALFVSVGTVKTHVHHIGTKLHVANRTEAVTRARRLGII